MLWLTFIKRGTCNVHYQDDIIGFHGNYLLLCCTTSSGSLLTRSLCVRRRFLFGMLSPHLQWSCFHLFKEASLWIRVVWEHQINMSELWNFLKGYSILTKSDNTIVLEYRPALRHLFRIPYRNVASPNMGTAVWCMNWGICLSAIHLPSICHPISVTHVLFSGRVIQWKVTPALF